MTSTDETIQEHTSGARARRATLWLIGAVLVARVLWLVLAQPFELAADEAQYWDWSRNLSLSYYSKGPGIAWLLWLSRGVLGDEQWALRIPAAISGAVAALAVARLAVRMADGDERAGLFAALAFMAVPAFHATSSFITIDGPYIACWALAAWAGHALLWTTGRARWAAALGLGAALGAGFLLKYTIALLLPGLVLAWWWRRARGSIGPLCVAMVVAVVISLPVFVWNAREGWPTVAHLAGHLGLGNEAVRAVTVSKPWSFNVLNPLEFVGSQLGMVGPALGVMVLAIRWARGAGARRVWTRHGGYALACGLPIIVFYVIASFVADAEGNWPIAGYTTLLALAGVAAAHELPRYAALVRAWRALPEGTRPRAGFLRAKPETPFQVLWHWALAYGIAGGVGLALLPTLDRVPVLGDVIPLHRISGHAQRAREAQALIDAARERVGLSQSGAGEPFYVADQYTRAALFAYYLPGRPVVRSATSFMGGRRSSYDFFPATSLTDPALVGRPVVLIGSIPQAWNNAFVLPGLIRLTEPTEVRSSVYFVPEFGGVRPHDPPPGSSR